MEENNEVVTEPKEESNEKTTFTLEEVEELKAKMKSEYEKSFDSKFNKAWAKEKSKEERNNAKTKELVELIKKQTGKKSIDELLDFSYEQYGVEKPKISDEDEEILGRNDAKKILDSNDEEYILEEVNRLADKERTAREQTAFMELGGYLTQKKKQEKIKNEIKEAGIEEELLNDNNFKDFLGKFNEGTSIKEVYDMYKTMNPKEKPYSTGSLKDIKAKSSELFTKEEFMALTSEDLKNPRIFEKAMKSKKFFK